jgi:uncharacterized protein
MSAVRGDAVSTTATRRGRTDVAAGWRPGTDASSGSHPSADTHSGSRPSADASAGPEPPGGVRAGVWPGHSCLYEGSVRHRRHGKVEDELHHRLFMVYLDLDELPDVFDGHRLWSARRASLAWFRRADYLGDPAVALADAVRALVAERTGITADGPIRLLTHMRCFGHCFNPVSFYYCFDARGEHVRAVVAEVTNTPWGERHAYVMAVDTPEQQRGAKVMRGRFAKCLHVSPLMGMDHIYDWRLTEPGERLSVHIESRPAGEDRAEPVFDATLSMRRSEISRGTLARVLARYPLLTVRILAGIYAHALRLRVRGARYFPHPRGGASSE